MNWRKIIYHVCFFASMTIVFGVMILSWLYPEHLR